jgi:hypothetical protein
MGSVCDFTGPVIGRADLQKTGRLSHSGFQYTFIALILCPRKFVEKKGSADV